jgi:polyisoprenoid-binding protein YceI
MATSTYNIDSSHSGVHFSVRHLVVSKVRGAFQRFTGVVQFDADDVSRSSVEVSIEAASVDTREPKRDAHLRSADFFDAEQFPTLTFKSTRITGNGDKLKIVGELTMRGVTREVTLDATFEGAGRDPWGGERLAWAARTSVTREDFGLKWNQALEAGGVLVGSKVEIELDVQAVKAAAKAA